MRKKKEAPLGISPSGASFTHFTQSVEKAKPLNTLACCQCRQRSLRSTKESLKTLGYLAEN
jgi:hypothetical protein